MKAMLLAHGMLLQDKNTQMIGTSLVKIEPLHYPEQPVWNYSWENRA
jgi:hypothetical protein